MNNYMIGIDIGTTSTKSVLFTEQGSVISTSTQEYPLYTPAPDVAEQDPEEIVQAVLRSVRGVMDQSGVAAEQILFVSCSSAMHSVIAMGQDNKPLTRCITWADNRSAAWSAQLQENGLGHRIYLRTGTPIHPMSPLTKLMWLRHDETELLGVPQNLFRLKNICSSVYSDNMSSTIPSLPAQACSIWNNWTGTQMPLRLQALHPTISRSSCLQHIY